MAAADTDPLHDLLLRGVPILEGHKVLGRCVLLARVGAGAMGVVYRAFHLQFGREVAVKVLRPSLAADAAFLERFEREAQLSMVVDHANAVRVHDVGFAAGLYHLVMEFVDGETVGQRVQRWGRMRQAEAVTVLQGVAAALAEAHARGIVHRDIKPDNFLVSRGGQVKLADLGLASAGDDTEAGGGAGPVRVGSPQYRAPEQWGTADVTPAADVWSLGAVLYFLLTGEHGVPPRSGDWILHHDFPSLKARRPELRQELHALFDRCIARDPSARFADAGALLAALSALGLGDEDLLRLDGESGAGAGQGRRVPSPAVLDRLARAVLGPAAAPAVAVAEGVQPPPVRPVAAVAGATRVRPGRGRASPWPWLVGLVAVAAILMTVLRGNGGAEPAGEGGRTQALDVAALREAWSALVAPRHDVPAPSSKVVVEVAEPPPGMRRLRAVLVPPALRGGSMPPGGVDLGPGQWRATLVGEQDGAHVLRLMAYHEQGLELELPPRAVVLDGAAPTVAIVAPAAEAVVAPRCEVRVGVGADAVRIELAARRPGNAGEGDAGLVLPWRRLELQGGQARAVCDLPTGAVELLVRASDSADNEARTSVRVEVDGEPPSLVPVAVPPWTNQGTLVLTGAAPGAERVFCRVGDAAPAAAPVSPPGDGFRFEVPLTTVGRQEFVLWAEDRAGNRSGEHRVATQRHLEPPPLVWRAPDADAPQPPGPLRVVVGWPGPVPAAEVRIAGRPAEASEGGFAASVEVHADRETEITVQATDVAGNAAIPMVRVLNRRWDEVQEIPTGNAVSFVRIPGGDHTIGAPERRVRVTLSPFWIARTEVTRAQWVAHGEPLPAWGPDWRAGADLPATGMTWHEATAWCARLTAAERARAPLPPRHRFVLPSEVQWEVACRAGSTTEWSHGAAVAELGGFAVYEASVLEPVRSRRPNRFGLFDMHGNASEWCHDVLDASRVAGVVDPLGPPGDQAAARGGDHLSPARSVTSYARRPCDKQAVDASRGFRPVLALRPE